MFYTVIIFISVLGYSVFCNQSRLAIHKHFEDLTGTYLLSSEHAKYIVLTVTLLLLEIVIFC